MTDYLLGIVWFVVLFGGGILFWVLVVKAVIDYAARRFAEEKRRER